jgi:hypothetical protein
MATASQGHVDQLLTTVASTYKNSGFFCDEVSPTVAVDKRSNKYRQYLRSDVSTVVDDRIGPTSKANEADYSETTGNYSVKDRALVGYMGDQEERNDDLPGVEDRKTANLMQRLMLAREKRIADLCTTSTNFASSNVVTLVNKWSDKTNGTPLDDINLGVATIPSSGEDRRLLFVMSRVIWNVLRVHPQLLGLKGLVAGQVSRKEAADYLEVDEVLVSDVWINTATIGQTATYGRVWSSTKAALIAVPKSAPDLETMAFTLTARMNPGIQTRVWEEPSRGKGGSRAIQPEFSDDEVVVQNDMAYLFQNAA